MKKANTIAYWQLIPGIERVADRTVWRKMRKLCRGKSILGYCPTQTNGAGAEFGRSL